MTVVLDARDFQPGAAFPATVPLSRERLAAFSVEAGRPWLNRAGFAAWRAAGGWGPAPANPLEFARNEALEIGGVQQQIRAYLETGAAGALCGTEYLHELEGTDKGQASARLGAGITAAMAHELFDVRALHHAANAPIVPAANAGNRRADYVGRVAGTSRWMAFEAKGSTTSSGPKAVADAKAQARTARLVDNHAVAQHIACLGRFRNQAQISVIVADPPPDDDGDEVTDETIDDLDVLRYGPIARALDAGRPAISVASPAPGGDQLDLFPMGRVGYFGAVRRVTDTLRRFDAERPSRPAMRAQLEETRDSFADSRRGVAADGATAVDDPVVMVGGEPHRLTVLPDGVAFAVHSSL